MGGTIAADLAYRRPSAVKLLVLINSAHDPLLVRFNLKPLRRLVPVIARFVKPRSVRFYMRQLYGTPLEITDENLTMYSSPYSTSNIERHFAFFDSIESILDRTLSERIKSIKIPILIIWGAKDKITPLMFGKSLHKTLTSSKLIIHPTAGHHLQEEEPAWLAAEILKFSSQIKNPD